jgi:hypothetical protein
MMKSRRIVKSWMLMLHSALSGERK